MRNVATEPNLDRATDRFIEIVSPALARLPIEGTSATAEGTRDAVHPLRDAVELCRALIDVDRLLTDEELQAFIDTFSHRIEDGIWADATPQNLRQRRIFRRARVWFEEPSELFSLLLEVDAREGSDFTWRYHDAAMAVAVCMFDLDG
ncbi:MAG: hypothetical protein ACI8Y4_002137 [Candidatus Poriferisodalaceae bacterium]|jgi:hypothetical protein